MANEKHLAILEQGVEAWNEWRHENPQIRPDLSGANLINANLSSANLIGADFSYAKLISAELINANLSRAKLNNADLIDAKLNRAKLNRANLIDAKLSRASLSEADLIDANLSCAILIDANLIHANLSRANLTHANLRRAKLSKANLSGASLIGVELTSASLSSTDLNDADLSYAKISSADLNSANLFNANLSNTDLSRADLSRADLSGADLSTANLSNSKLGSAKLKKAKLWAASFSETNLQSADFTDALLGNTIFANTDLSTAEGLDSVKHTRPSEISIRTLYKSIGNISDAFLRGCGLSDWEIENAKLYNPDLSNEEINNIHYRVHDLRVSRAFQINPLFISYSHSDSLFVDKIEKRLTQQGIRFWRDTHHAKAGRLEKQIDQAIHLNDVILLILSEHSTNSDWVEHEARKAREKEKKTGKDALCPVALDDNWKTCRWPERLREQIMEYNILDFSGWQDANEFQKLFGKLLEGLNLFYK